MCLGLTKVPTPPNPPAFKGAEYPPPLFQGDIGEVSIFFAQQVVLLMKTGFTGSVELSPAQQFPFGLIVLKISFVELFAVKPEIAESISADKSFLYQFGVLLILKAMIYITLTMIVLLI